MNMQINEALLLELLGKLKPSPVMVVGDLILDEFVSGEVTRLSREAPLPVIVKKKEELIPGGAANTANNISALGGIVYSVGTVGSDLSGTNLKRVLAELGVKIEGLVTDKNNPTTTKTRISASSKQSVKQQVARVDTLPEPPLASEIIEAILENIELLQNKADTILISDYGNGVITDRIIERCLELAKSGQKNLIVDSQEDLRKFQFATILTPNQPEAERVLGYKISDQLKLAKAGKELLEMTNAKGVLITRGADGMSLFERNGEVMHIPAFNKRDVFDVTGAGDTVVATISLGLSSGLTMKESVLLANLAASIVVRRFGTSTTTIAEMEKVLLTEKIL